MLGPISVLTVPGTGTFFGCPERPWAAPPHPKWHTCWTARPAVRFAVLAAHSPAEEQRWRYLADRFSPRRCSPLRYPRCPCSPMRGDGSARADIRREAVARRSRRAEAGTRQRLVSAWSCCLANASFSGGAEQREVPTAASW